MQQPELPVRAYRPQLLCRLLINLLRALAAQQLAAHARVRLHKRQHQLPEQLPHLRSCEMGVNVRE